ncbi:hypothetical protein BD289DRAFT_230748 [Coniella lustricola]|uniref:Uncharacterized protein n=1 Tax=Coniella lustricola TaxID=2025994 RepID=A0A2T3AAB6_9PEZI|nr:hypothetical protein BD289DRAFT_230748 [Coniella lustricola]
MRRCNTPVPPPLRPGAALLAFGLGVFLLCLATRCPPHARFGRPWNDFTLFDTQVLVDPTSRHLVLRFLFFFPPFFFGGGGFLSSKSTEVDCAAVKGAVYFLFPFVHVYCTDNTMKMGIKYSMIYFVA